MASRQANQPTRLSLSLCVPAEVQRQRLTLHVRVWLVWVMFSISLVSSEAKRSPTRVEAGYIDE